MRTHKHSLGQWRSVYHLFQKSNRMKCFYNLPIAEDVDGIYVDDLVGDTIMKNKRKSCFTKCNQRNSNNEDGNVHSNSNETERRESFSLNDIMILLRL